MKIRKGGRPRKDGARKPSGDLKPQIDHGSPYALLRRAEALGKDVSNIVDFRQLTGLQDHRASHLLGILHAQGRITGEQAWAGRRYAAAYVQSVRRPQARTGGALMVAASVGGAYASIMDDVAPETDEEREARLANLRSDYLAMRSRLMRHGHHVTAVVERVAVFDEMIRPGQLDQLQRGLQCLFGWLEQHK